MKRKILVITTTRADYGLLKSLISEINASEELELALVVSGTHLEDSFGLTVKEIEEDAIPVKYKLPIITLVNGKVDVVQTMARMQTGLDQILKSDKPDVVVLLGDRYEVFAAASVCLLHSLPIAHIHGGELTLGAVDDAFRHSITKMSWWHFATTETYRQRIIHLGEAPHRTFNTGAPAIDHLESSDATVEELEAFLKIKLNKPILLATFHPETLTKDKIENQVKILWDAIIQSSPGTVVFTKANADAGGPETNEILQKLFQEKDAPHGVLVPSLGHRRYLSLMKLADVAIGNSSSLVIEAPMVRTPSINIGLRQAGRARANSIIDVDFDTKEIAQAIARAYSQNFKDVTKTGTHPFGEPGVAGRIVEILSQEKLPENLIKEFYE